MVADTDNDSLNDGLRPPLQGSANLPHRVPRATLRSALGYDNMPRWGVLAVRSILYGTFLTFFLSGSSPHEAQKLAANAAAISTTSLGGRVPISKQQIMDKLHFIEIQG